MMRINKFLAECGVCSRREADRLIESGRVMVNGRIAESGMQVSENDIVEADGKRVSVVAKKTVLAYNKPVGVTCTEKDSHARLTITQALDYPIRLTYAGRLDKDSDGLIIMTNDGALIQKMMKGANYHEKEYEVRVDKELSDGVLTAMSRGVYLAELGQKTRPCKIVQTGEKIFRITLTQGLNRQIRRMCAQYGYRVIKLTRTRVMNIELKGLKSGEYRELTGEELSMLYKLCKNKDGNRGYERGKQKQRSHT